MKAVTWLDDDGWQRRRLIRDTDLDSAASGGIPQEPPDVNNLDWAAIKRDLHNELMNRGLLTYKDVERLQNSLGAVAMTVLRPYLRHLFTEVNNE